MQKKLSVLLVVALCLFFGTSCNQVRYLYFLTKTRTPQKDFIDSIPFQRKMGLIVIKAHIDGSKKAYDFIFDTGASSSVISSDVVDELHLKNKFAFGVINAEQQERKQQFILINNVEVSHVVFRHVLAAKVDFGNRSVLPCIARAGIIGANMMRRCNWRIDYQNHKIYLSDHSFPGNDSLQTIPFKQDLPGKPYITVNLSDSLKVKVLLDSGSSGFLDVPLDFATRKKMLINRLMIRQIDGTTQGLFGDRLDTDYIFKQLVRVNHITLPYTHVEVSKHTHLKTGVRIFNPQVLVIDFHKHLIHIQPGPGADSTWNTAFGFTPEMNAHDSIFVGSLYDSTPAAKAGLHVGDYILSVNGQPVDTASQPYCSFHSWRLNLLKTDSMQLTVKGRQDTIMLIKQKPKPIIYFTEKKR